VKVRIVKKFRTLRADEIECRISTVKSNGLSLLLYKDARCDMNILDEIVGAENWQRSHSRDNANCTVSIWDNEKKQWVSKEDTGTESFTEKEKGLASDSFKRACFNWGIGRELYTAPFIWIASSECTIKEKNDKKGFTCFDKFFVSQIDYDDNKCINCLQIKNSKNKKVVFELGKKESFDNSMEESTTSTQAKLKLLEEECKLHNIDLQKWAVDSYQHEVKDLTGEEIASMLLWIKKSFGDKS
jgi:hypothetical protein